MGFFDKIKAGLAKTRAVLSETLDEVFSGFATIDDDFYDDGYDVSDGGDFDDVDDGDFVDDNDAYVADEDDGEDFDFVYDDDDEEGFEGF